MSVAAAATPAARPRVVAAVAAVVALAAAALIVVGFLRMPGSDAVAGVAGGSDAVGKATSAVAAADQIAVDFTSFNYRTLAQDQARVAANLTPTFRATYLAQSRPLRAVIVRARSSATSQVVADGLSSFDPAAGKASVIVALNVTSRNIKTQGTVQYYRFSVQLQHVGTKWLASNVMQE